MSKTIDRKTLRKALRLWDRTSQLGHSPLAKLVIVEARRATAGYQPSETGYGLALRDVLQAAVHQTRPSEGEQDYYDKRWRPFLILNQQYFDGRSPDYVAEQMGIARSTYDHAQADALEVVAEYLREWEGRGVLPEVASFAETGPLDQSKPAFNVPPMPPYGLVGRERLVDDLRATLFTEKAKVALSGLPGVGKTALAISIAHDQRVREHFSDGVLWAGLGQHANLLSQLSIWAVALGLPLGEIAKLATLRDRAGAIHAAIGDRRMLLVIDDVWESYDGLALLVGGPNCSHLFTTRMPRIAVELVGEGVREVHELEQGDGQVLLRAFVPKLEVDIASSLVRRVDGLPLGLVIIGKYLQGELRSGQARRMHRAVDRIEHAGDLMQVAHPQSALDQQPSLPTDLPLSLGTVIDLTLKTLKPALQDALIALSIFPPKPVSFSEEAAIHISGSQIEVLDSLSDHGLLENIGEDRYTLHRTISELARQCLEGQLVGQRYLEYYLQFVENNRDEHLLLEVEAQNIIAGLDMALESGMQEDLIRGVNAYFAHMEIMGLLEMGEKYLLQAEAAARELNDEAGLIMTLANLGKLSQRKAAYDRSLKYYDDALELARKLDHVEAECLILQGLGAAFFSLGEYERAAGYYERGLEMLADCEAPDAAIGLSANMGALLVTRGELERGEAHFQVALELARELGDRANVSAMLTNLGILAARGGDFALAQDHFQESLAIARATGMQKNIGYLLLNLGTLASDQGEGEQAQSYFLDALRMAEIVGDRAQVSQIHGNLGALAMKRGEYKQAESHLREGLGIAREIGHPEHTIHLLINLGELHREQGDTAEATSTLNEALALAESINHQRYINIVKEARGKLE